MDVSNARLCLLLHSIPKLSDPILTRLFLHYGTAREIVESRIGDWCSLGVSAEAVRNAQSLLAGSEVKPIPGAGE